MLIVQKFGGTSVANPERIRASAALVQAEYARGNQLVVVVSAMAGHTNQLVDWCAEIAPFHERSEYDVVLASGEQVTAGLMALALQAYSLPACSWMGWQVPIETDDCYGGARIIDIPRHKLQECLTQGKIPVIPGFQGVGSEARITTLGRGGSDLSAVALAATLKADRCDIYTDVDGIYTCDPRIVAKARKLDKITYEEMLEMASLGAKILQPRSVALAMKYGIRTQVLSSFAAADSRVSENECEFLVGTIVVSEDEILEHQPVTGIAYSRDEAKITLTRVSDRPGVAAQIFGPLAQASVNVDMIVQNISDDGHSTDMTFTVGRADLERSVQILEQHLAAIGYQSILPDPTVVKISIIGVGMRSHAGIAQTMFTTLGEKGINIQVIATSEIKVSVLISEDYTELALRSLHAAYGLDAV